MPLDDQLLARAVRQKTKFARPVFSGVRADKLQALDAAIARGQIDFDTLTDDTTGKQRFVLGLTPMDSSVVMS